MGVDRYILLGVVAWLALGVIALVAAGFFWRRIERRFPEWMGGTAIAFARAGAAFSAIQSRAASGPGAAWGEVQKAAIASWLTWELTGIVAGWKLNRGKRRDAGRIAVLEDRQEASRRAVADLEAEGLFRTRLLDALRFALLDKSERIRTQLGATAAAGRAPIHRARAALDPDLQSYVILKQMGFLLQGLLPHTLEALDQNFRVGLYVARDGFLGPTVSADLLSRRPARFLSFERHRDRFAVDNVIDPSCAVECLATGTLVIVPDGALRSGFYMHEAQRRYLKSLIAYPIIPYGAEDGVAVIVVDTNIAGHFREKDRAVLRDFMRDFAARLVLERYLDQILR